MNPLPSYADELDVLERDIHLLRELVDAAVEHHDVDRAHALSEIIDDRKTQLRRVLSEGASSH